MKKLFQLAFLFWCTSNVTISYGQTKPISFGHSVELSSIASSGKEKLSPLQWLNVNTLPGTWSVQQGQLMCTGQPIGVMRSEKQFENFLLHIEWMHLESGGNSGIFVWSTAIPGDENRLPDGIEVQMLELDWVNMHPQNGEPAPIAYVHGELFGVGGVKTLPDNPRGERSKSIENLCKGKGEWNTYDVVCVDGVVKLSVNGKFVNGLSKATQKKGYICFESEGAPIHFRNLKIIELPPGSASF